MARATLLFLLVAAAAALQPVALDGVKPKRPSHALRSARFPATLLATPKEPAPTLAGSLVAGTYTGLMQFTFAAACASVIFAPVGLPLTIGIQHVLLGFCLMQIVVTKTTGVPNQVALAVPSFEVPPFLAKFALLVGGLPTSDIVDDRIYDIVLAEALAYSAPG